ncbi:MULTISPECIES: DUF3999 family protein [Providencia]|uniref:DUF3999 family protein n=1 Tax=Providencia TaxID=586 RepID=UPI000EF92080|nr:MULTISPECIES: DUF3999 family protein [Providencia]EMF0916664.1 DUF3999 family protein [Providencia stuartii]MCR4081198.1 DUF3999 domain-containing protein [Providencia stuartii]MTC20017.1 DUF3999 family protein [Providencia stuartii]RMA10679.1 DUF3999 domain-containing protein [Providencia stuartii]
MKLTKSKGKWLTFVYLSFSFLLSSFVHAQEQKALTPYDFYQGIELKYSSDNSSFAWLELPSEAYINSAYPQTLQDVRVFNGTGQEVPSALFYDTEERRKISQVSFALQRLIIRADQVNSKEETHDDQQYLLIETQPSKLTRIELPAMQQAKDAVYQSYLLTRQNNNQEDFPIQTLSLQWMNNQQDWQGKVFIYASDNKQDWVNISAYQPVISLNSNSGGIYSNTIKLLEGHYVALRAPYLMVIIVAAKETKIPDLTMAQGTSMVVHSTRRQETCHFITNNEGVSLNQLIYRLPSPQPLSAIVIQLRQANRVLPLHIEYTSTSGEEWLPLTNIVAYNQIQNGQEIRNPELVLNDLMVKKLRITALKGSWDDKPPYIEGKRDAVNLMFNVQGASPYLLVWGSQLAGIDNISYQELLGQPLTIDELMHRYPKLYVPEEIIELGGEEQLTSNDFVINEFDWMTITLWVLLGVGIIVLLYFCWYLLKEVNAKSSE